jgi:hypothetical protein
MTKSIFRKIGIVLSSLAVLSGGFGIGTAHARDGGFPPIVPHTGMGRRLSVSSRCDASIT